MLLSHHERATPVFGRASSRAHESVPHPSLVSSSASYVVTSNAACSSMDFYACTATSAVGTVCSLSCADGFSPDFVD